MFSRKVISASLLALVAFGTALPAHADVGVAVTTGSIALDRPVVQGESYGLPQFGIRNPGTERANYAIEVGDIAGDAFLGADASWFTFSPSRLTLAPGESQTVNVRISVPGGAEPGDYQVLLKAVLASDATGASIGAAAASRLTFHVDENRSLLASAVSFVSSPIAFGLIAAAALAIAGRSMRKRFSLALVRKPTNE